MRPEAIAKARQILNPEDATFAGGAASLAGNLHFWTSSMPRDVTAETLLKTLRDLVWTVGVQRCSARMWLRRVGNCDLRQNMKFSQSPTTQRRNVQNQQRNRNPPVDGMYGTSCLWAQQPLPQFTHLPLESAVAATQRKFRRKCCSHCWILLMM